MLEVPEISKRSWILIAVAIMCAVGWFQNREVKQYPGVLVNSEPDQVLSHGKPRFRHQDYVLEKLAEYKVTGRVLGRSRYIFDVGAKLAPYDLALGWKTMSDSKYLDDLSISQGQRFLYFSWPGNFELLESDIFDFSSNTHIIPANDEIASQISSLRVGEIVTLSGNLVAAYLNGDLTWKSSLSRQDRGAGACELMYVTRVLKK